MPGRSASTAGASAQARYRAIRAAQRQERVVARIVICGAAGSMAAGLFGWLYGLVGALAALLAHALYLRVKPDAVNRWRQGAVAERRTGRSLGRLDPAAYHVLHDRALPGAPRANLDHLVVGMTGVYAIATRRWPRFVRLRADDRLWAGPRPASRLVVSARRAARIVGELLSQELDHPIEVSAIVAVHGARLPYGGILFAGVALQRATRVPRLVRRQPVVFTTAQVATLVAAAERMLPPMAEVPRPVVDF